MNILMFVMAMLMMFGIMTYSKYSQFLSQKITQSQFENYMEFSERKYINEKAVSAYFNTHYSKSSSPKNPDSKPEPRNQNSSKLPIHSLLTQREANSDETSSYQNTKIIFKELIKNLYSQQEFYKKIQNKRPDFIDELIAALPNAVADLPDQKITKAKNLANLDLKDQELNDFLYLILKGFSIPNKTSQGITIEGYPSLMNFLDVRKNKKLRIYLASKELLDIIFNPSIADETIQMREFLYKEVANNHMSSQDATEKFKNVFKDQVYPLLKSDDFDFSVTRTDPKCYRTTNTIYQK